MQATMTALYRPPLWAPWMHAVAENGDARLPVTGHPDNYRVLVAGGAGKHSCVIHSWGVTTSVTLAIER